MVANVGEILEAEDDDDNDSRNDGAGFAVKKTTLEKKEIK